MRGRVLTALASLTAAVVATPPATTSAAIIGIDDRSAGPKGPLWSDTPYAPFRDAVAASGHTLTPRQSFTQSDLEGLDTLILLQPMYKDQSFSSREMEDVQGFVARGGGLIVVGEGGWESDTTVDNFNALVSPYGVAYAAGALATQGATITGFNPHPLTQGVETIGLDFYRPLSRVAAPAVDLTSGGINVLAVVSGVDGAGNVLFLSDLSSFAGPESNRPLSFEDNLRLLRNVLQVATVPEPGAWWIGLGAAGLFALRRRRAARGKRSAR